MIGGGYVISPLPPQGGYPHRCLVKHMLTVDWKHWKTCWSPPRDKDITLRVLERVAGKLVYCKLSSCRSICYILLNFSFLFGYNPVALGSWPLEGLLRINSISTFCLKYGCYPGSFHVCCPDLTSWEIFLQFSKADLMLL